jgi:hypothetical protein
VLFELALVDGLVVDFLLPEVVVGHSVHVDALLLRLDLLRVQLGQTLAVLNLPEELVVLVGRRPVVDRRLEPHPKVRLSHRQGIALLRCFLLSQFFGRVGLAG